MLKELQTTATYVVERLQTVPEVHSLKSRIKEAEHLVEKIIRKKYQGSDVVVDCESYERIVTDLVGVRVLHLFKDDWLPIHNFIGATWELREDPIAYVRDGDGDRQS
jgi:putative GTP pyrophosphokinase